ncbi:MAG TPA: hypothetical protein PLY93_04715 [Turneriella sp.]|nr:hypothetical protein [Turneriella sp.]
MNSKPLIYFLVFVGTLFPIAADFNTETLPDVLAQKVERYLGADTAKARAGMVDFTNEDIEKITSAFKKEHSRSDQRLFWLNEEGYRRHAELASAERIYYLYLAVLAALAIIAGFMLLTYRRARALVVASKEK